MQNVSSFTVKLIASVPALGLCPLNTRILIKCSFCDPRKRKMKIHSYDFGPAGNVDIMTIFLVLYLCMLGAAVWQTKGKHLEVSKSLTSVWS